MDTHNTAPPPPQSYNGFGQSATPVDNQYHNNNNNNNNVSNHIPAANNADKYDRDRDRGRDRDRDKDRGRDRDRDRDRDGKGGHPLDRVSKSGAPPAHGGGRSPPRKGRSPRGRSPRGRPRGRSRSRDRRRRRSPSSSSSGSSPSPPRRKKKETSGWDQQPAPGSQPLTLPPSTLAAVAPAVLAAAAPVVAPVFGGMHPARLAQLANTAIPQAPSTQIITQLISNAPSFLAAATASAAHPSAISAAQRQARRLYAGNLPNEATEENVRNFFNDVMKKAHPNAEPGDPLTAVFLNMPKKFAFLEFRTIDEAGSALVFDGINFMGNIVKLRRPSDFGNMGIADAKPVPLTTETNPKIFCGGLPYELSDQEVKELLQVYGPIKTFNLVRDKDSPTSKGYCFFEYADQAVTDDAIKGLNGLELGNKTLTVRRATIRTEPPPSTGIINPLLSITPAAISALQPTRVLCLLQMVAEDELHDAQEYADIVDDIRHECSKYGEVKNVVIPRPMPGQNVPGVGKVFVQFASVDQTITARGALEGRKFANRTVIAQYWNEDLFNRQQYQ